MPLNSARANPLLSMSARKEESRHSASRTRELASRPKCWTKIFKPFERGVSSRHYAGLGLGLFIVRTIVEGLGGTIRVQSRPRMGSTFIVELHNSRRVHEPQ